MTPVGPATVQKRVSASREAVWAVLEVNELRQEWWPETEIDFVIGGSVSESWREGEGDDTVERDASGTVDVLIRGHALGFRWQEASDAHATDVLITLRSHDSETAVVVSETGFGRFSDAAKRTVEAQQGWTVLLDDLAETVARHPELPVVPTATDTAEQDAVDLPETLNDAVGIVLPEPPVESAPELAPKAVAVEPEPEPEPEAEEPEEPEDPAEEEPEEENKKVSDDSSDESELLDFDEFIRSAFGDDAAR